MEKITEHSTVPLSGVFPKYSVQDYIETTNYKNFSLIFTQLVQIYLYL